MDLLVIIFFSRNVFVKKVKWLSKLCTATTVWWGNRICETLRRPYDTFMVRRVSCLHNVSPDVRHQRHSARAARQHLKGGTKVQPNLNNREISELNIEGRKYDYLRAQLSS